MRPVCLALVVFTVSGLLPGTRADDLLYRYEGDILLSELPDEWPGDPCENQCTAFIEDGHFVVFWPEPARGIGFLHWVAEVGEPPPPTLWVEWRFRSNHPLGLYYYGCDGEFVVRYDGTLDSVYMYGDAAISFSGGSVVTGLDIEEFHTYRFESLDGMNSRFAVDGLVFMVRFDNSRTGGSYLQLSGSTGCGPDGIPNQKHEWDFVRYGTISFGERIIATDPPAGYLDPAVYPDLDRFTVTFDAGNYVYIDDITVQVTGGIAPEVVQTLRPETDDVDTVEIVLDRALPANELTRFIFNDGQATNVIEYWFNATVTGASCDISDGSCLDLTTEGCAAVAGAVYRGDDTSCEGDNNSDGHDDACDDLFIIPTVSSWGLIILTLLTLIAGTVALSRKPVPRS